MDEQIEQRKEGCGIVAVSISTIIAVVLLVVLAWNSAGGSFDQFFKNIWLLVSIALGGVIVGAILWIAISVFVGWKKKDQSAKNYHQGAITRSEIERKRGER